MQNSATKKQSVEEWLGQGNQINRVPRGATSPRDPMSQDWLWWKRKGEPTRGERKYRLEDAVQRLGWTQVALKTKLCIGQSTLTQYLSGRRQVPLDVLYEVERLAKERAAKRERSE